MRRLVLGLAGGLLACGSLLGLDDIPDHEPGGGDSSATASSGGSSGQGEWSSGGGSSGESSSSGGGSTSSGGGSEDGGISTPPERFVEEVGIGWTMVCARTRAGHVWCWGDNNYGQLGNATYAPVLTPTRVPGLEGVSRLAVGSFHVCAVVQGGEVRCWGRGELGQVGAGSPEATRPAPAPVVVQGRAALTGVTDLAAGFAHTCALVAGAVRCWGSNEDGEAGQDVAVVATGLAYSAPVEGATGIAAFGSGAASHHTCAAKADGTAICWGNNRELGLGSDSISDPWRPRAVPGVGAVTQLCTGPRASSARVADGRVLSWGVSRVEFVENGIPAHMGSEPQPVPGLSGVTQIACSDRHGCALGLYGVVCFGSDHSGQLGRGNAPLGEAPHPPNSVSVLDDAVSVAAGGARSCSATRDGSLYCWGENLRSDFGLGVADTYVTRPTRVPGFGPE